MSLEDVGPGMAGRTNLALDFVLAWTAKHETVVLFL